MILCSDTTQTSIYKENGSQLILLVTKFFLNVGQTLVAFSDFNLQLLLYAVQYFSIKPLKIVLCALISLSFCRIRFIHAALAVLLQSVCKEGYTSVSIKYSSDFWKSFGFLAEE